MERRGGKIFTAALIILLGLGFCLSYSGLWDGAGLLEGFRRLVLHHYILAIACYLACTILGTVFLAVPGIVYAVAAGAAFGPVVGTALCVIGAGTGAALAFLMGRYVLGDRVRPLVERHRYLRYWLLDNSGFNQWILLVITRLVPLFPFNLQNFAYGITSMGFWQYTLGTFLLIIPGTAMYTFASAGLLSADAERAALPISVVLCLLLLAASWLLRRKFRLTDTKKRNCGEGAWE